MVALALGEQLTLVSERFSNPNNSVILCLHGLDPHKKGYIVLTGVEAWGIQFICLGVTAVVHRPCYIGSLTLSPCLISPHQSRHGGERTDGTPGSSQALLSPHEPFAA